MAANDGKITALYERLSKDDILAGESMSIQNQKAILEEYAARNGFTNIKHYFDDGTSGTVFNRPGLNAMIEEVKAGNVAVVIIKDQSRIGRDVLEVGLLKRTFEENNVRYIAANDGLDSANGFDIMSVFRDVFNEYYVADTSKKIRAVKKAKALQGKATNRPPYGYKTNEPGGVWEFDEPAAAIVREMFRRFIAGDGAYIMAKDLHFRGIPTPKNHYQLSKGITPQKTFLWTTTSVVEILENPTYVGKYVSQRKTTASYKHHKQFIRPEEEWIVTENHHIPLVSNETFDAVQRLRANRRRVTRTGLSTALSGLLFCKDCNSRLTYVLQHTCEGYVCAKYRGSAGVHYAGHNCSRHYISIKDIEGIALAQIKATVEFAKSNTEEFARIVYQRTHRESARDMKNKTVELGKAERRIADLDRIIKRLYEDNISEKLSDDRFNKLLGDYESEQAELNSKVTILNKELDELSSRTANLQSFMNIVAECGEITELTAELARRFIEKIVVHEAKIAEGTRRKRESQEIEVYFTYIGQFNPTE